MYVGNVAAPTWVSGVDFAINKAGWNTYTWTTPTITNAAVIGGNLGIRIYGKTQTANSLGFIDNINLSVISDVVPEPATVGLFGMATLGLMAFRRWHSRS